MIPDIVLKHEFVEFIPEELEQDKIYVSIRFATASHLCVCGCKSKVVTPIRPTDWKLIFDGRTVSLDSSIGNWSFPCQSHYWIRNNRVKWAPKWSKEKITSGRARDEYEKQSYFGGQDTHAPEADRTATEPKRTRKSFWQIFKWW